MTTSGEKRPPLIQAAEDVQALLNACRDGVFYEDYDASMSMLRAARHGLNALVRAAIPPRSGRDEEAAP